MITHCEISNMDEKFVNSALQFDTSNYCEIMFVNHKTN